MIDLFHELMQILSLYYLLLIFTELKYRHWSLRRAKEAMLHAKCLASFQANSPSVGGILKWGFTFFSVLAFHPLSLHDLPTHKLRLNNQQKASSFTNIFLFLQ